MNLTRKLAYSQIKTNPGRTFWTITGIVLATAMITAVFGFAASGDEMLRERAGDSEYYMNLYSSMMIGISAVFVSVIIFASVIVVSNSFRVSAGERIVQFGILKSVGATKKQITATIMHESIYYCLSGIPIGIVLGLLVNLTGVQLVDHFLAGANSLNPENSAPIVLNFVFSWQAILLSIICSLTTVCLSAWLPARKAAKIAAIDAIRGAGEIKAELKRFNANWFVRALFGFEGTLASKSLKRSRRNFRATVVSLTVSIILFIIVGSFGLMMTTMTTVFFSEIDANVISEFYTHNHVSWDDNGELIDRKYSTINSRLASDITNRMREFPDTNVIGVGADGHSFVSYIDNDMLTPSMSELLAPHIPPESTGERTPVILMVTDTDTYAIMCRSAGVPIGSNILLNQYTWYHLEGGRSVITPMNFTGQTLQILNRYSGDEFELTLHGSLSIGEIPNELLSLGNSIATVIIPELDALTYRWYAETNDSTGFTEFADDILNTSVTIEPGVSRMSVFNLDKEHSAMQDTGRLIMTFIYGFIIMLTLIGLTNVISTISTNVRSRSREFAILQSVGMTRSGLGRMLNLESILCSIKSILIGVPIGLFITYIIHNILSEPVEFPFMIPWMPIIQCTLGVLAVTWITMRYSASRLKGNNIVEKIRSVGV